MFRQVTCSNNHVIAIIPHDAKTVDSKYISNPKLKHLKNSHRLSRCPDCGSQSFLLSKKPEPKKL